MSQFFQAKVNVTWVVVMVQSALRERVNKILQTLGFDEAEIRPDLWPAGYLC